MNAREGLPADAVDPHNASVSARLIRRAARRMPPGALADRLEEEWIAALAEQHGAINRMCFALGCCWARHVIGHEWHLYGAGLGAAGHGRAGVISLAYPSLAPKRAVVLLVIVCVHIAAALAFIYGMRLREPPMPQPQMIGKIYTDPESVTPPPPMPQPQFKQEAILIPRLLPIGPLPSDASDTVQSMTQPAASLPAPVLAPIRVSGGIGKDFPNAADYYPAGAIRLGEAGRTGVSVCVDEHGRLTGDPKIASSSGSLRLDGAALAVARAGSGHYRSTTENGRAISGCFTIGVRFALKS